MRAVLFLVVVLQCGHAAIAQNPPALDQPRVDQLVRQLGSPNRSDRDQAEADLVAAGPDALTLLPPDPPDPAVAEAVQRIRQKLEIAAARRAGRPSTITLKGSFTLAKVAEAIRRQTGQSVVIPGSDIERTAALDWSEIPFWDGLHQLEQQFNLTVGSDGARQTLLLSPRPEGRAPLTVSTSGPCRIEIVSQAVRPNLVDPGSSLLQIRWRVRVEPRLRPLYLIVADRDCLLKKGSETFPALSPDARREIPCDRWVGCEIDTAFSIPKDLDVQGVTFTAGATLKLAALPLEMVFDDLDKPRPAIKRRGAAIGEVRDVAFVEPERSMSFLLTVAYNRGGPEFESHRMWIYQNAAWLRRKAGGTQIKPDHVDLRRIGESGATLSYVFEKLSGGLADYEFVYEAPSLVIDVPVQAEKLAITAGTQ